MNKLFTLFIVGVLMALHTSAQTNLKITSIGHAESDTLPGAGKISSAKFSTAKTTTTPPRTYSHFDYNAKISSFDTTGGADFHFVRLWADSTIRQTLGSSTGTVSYSSVAQVIYPMDSIFNRIGDPTTRGLMQVTNSDSYGIDSVKISGLYLTGSTKSAAVVDTLIISLTCQPSNIAYYYAKSVWAGYGVDLSPYLSAADHDTLLAIAPLSADSINRAALAYTGSPARVFWKVPLTASMRSPIATASIVTWAFAPPGGTYPVPAGYIPAVSYTFKSGDTWVPNVDHIDSFHRFMPLFAGTVNIMPYWGKFNATMRDRSSSSLMYATHPGNGYEPTVMVEAKNSIAFEDEYLAASFVIYCPTCSRWPVVTSIDDDLINGSTPLSNVSISPNPSNEYVNLSFTAQEKAEVTVSITDIYGKTVATQNMNVQNTGQTNKVTFNTTNLPSGTYLCTIRANGQTTTNRLTIVH